MIRLLIRVYLLLLVLFGLGLMVPVVTAILHWESNQDRLEATFVGPMRMIRDTLQEADDPSLEVIRLQKHFRFPVELLYFNSDGGAPDRLERSLN